MDGRQTLNYGFLNKNNADQNMDDYLTHSKLSSMRTVVLNDEFDGRKNELEQQTISLYDQPPNQNSKYS